MRASYQEQTGGAGVSQVKVKFQKIRWGPVENPSHDLGTDLFVQARDTRGFSRGPTLTTLKDLGLTELWVLYRW